MDPQVLLMYVHSTTPAGNSYMFLSRLQSCHTLCVTWHIPNFSHIESKGRRLLLNTGVH